MVVRGKWQCKLLLQNIYMYTIVTLQVVYDHVGKCRKLPLRYFIQINLILFCLTTVWKSEMEPTNGNRGTHKKVAARILVDIRPYWNNMEFWFAKWTGKTIFICFLKYIHGILKSLRWRSAIKIYPLSLYIYISDKSYHTAFKVMLHETIFNAILLQQCLNSFEPNWTLELVCLLYK